ncbi:MAG: hypothetical protein HYZ74_08015, partial [Elusimicrobia bacterium]|nr:hypothetical protein [Elusimicrobiota bacterium]
AFTGVISAALTRQAGLSLSPWRDIFAPNLGAQVLIALAGYALAWPGLRPAQTPVAPPQRPKPNRDQRLTLAALALLSAAVLGLKMDVGVAALVLAASLELARAADHKSALERIPWSAIMMVCGVSTLVAVASHGGGMGHLSGWLARAGSARAVTATVAFAAAFTSIYSSSSGVVMPAFLSMIPDLAARSGAAPAALASAINVSSHLVDISPLSTLGALCVAAAPEPERGRLFQRLFYGGLGMSVTAAAMGYLVFGKS